MICCVTGHRPKGVPFSGEASYTIYRYLLAHTVEELIGEGYDRFITGMAALGTRYSMREKKENPFALFFCRK